MAVQGESKGLILFARDHREKDQLVKIFTEKYGKLMFFVRNAKRQNSVLTSATRPFTEAVYIGQMNSEGLSFLNDVKEVEPFQLIQQDIFVSAYATYILNLVDVAIEDQTYDPALYGFTRQALDYLNKGMDPEIITNIFEVQLLNRFGFEFQWQSCCVCGETKGKFDFSSKFSGVLCQRHFGEDDHRYHADPKAIHFIRLFSAITLDKIESIDLKADTKLAIRQTVDLLYDEFTGVRLKSKKFIDQMKSWEGMLKPLDKPDETVDNQGE